MSLQKTEMLSLGRKLFWLIALRSDLTDELIEKKVNIDENVMFSNLMTVETDLKEGEKKNKNTKKLENKWNWTVESNCSYWNWLLMVPFILVLALTFVFPKAW